MKNHTPLFFFLFISSSFLSCHNCCLPKPMPITEGANGTENRVDWKPIMTDTIKNDTITVYGKTDYDVIKFKFALSDVGNVAYAEFKKPYLLGYYLVAPTIAVYKPDATANNLFRAYYLDEASTHIKWLIVNFSFVFKNITPAPNSFFGPSNLNGGFSIKMP